jgi:hypothetical protein
VSCKESYLNIWLTALYAKQISKDLYVAFFEDFLMPFFNYFDQIIALWAFFSNVYIITNAHIVFVLALFSLFPKRSTAQLEYGITAIVNDEVKVIEPVFTQSCFHCNINIFLSEVTLQEQFFAMTTKANQRIY